MELKNLVLRRRGADLIAELYGEIDSSNTVEIRRKIEEAYVRCRSRNLIFDFCGVDFMDSSAIGLIIGRYKLATAAGGQVAVTGLTPNMERIFHAAGLFRIVSHYPSTDEALKAI